MANPAQAGVATDTRIEDPVLLYFPRGVAGQRTVACMRLKSVESWVANSSSSTLSTWFMSLAASLNRQRSPPHEGGA